MKTPARIDVGRIINDAPISSYQWRIFALLFLIVVIDGYDTQCIAFVAPAISRDWGLKAGSFGPIFSAGLLGSMVGAVVIGTLADRIGRKLLILASIVIFAAFTGACATATSFEELLAYRVIAGLGLGGALINCLPLASEFSPERTRTLVVSSCLWGYPFGAVLGGLIAGDLLTTYGWRSIFVVGTVLPILILPFIVALLPESIRYMTLTAGLRSKTIAAILNKIELKRRFSEHDQFYLSEVTAARGSVKALFGKDLVVGTLLLWTAGFCSLVVVYLLVNWIPTALNQAGLPIKLAAIGASVLSFAGIVGNISIAKLAGTRNPLRWIAASYLCGGVAVATIGFTVSTSTFAVMTSIFFTGFFVIGGQITLTAYATNFYPTAIRGTGGGFYSAVARTGSLVGPLAGGAVLAVTKDPSALFLACTVPALAVVLVVTVLSHWTRRKTAGESAMVPSVDAVSH